MSIIALILILIASFLIEILYFKIADHYDIIDTPNHRSSHNAITIRGGGIIFSISAIIFFCICQFQYPWFMLGLFLISLISFLDDLMTLNNKIRLLVHLVSVALVFTEWGIWEFHWAILLIAFIFIIGTINAYNFMDGINGITGAYSLATLTSLYYINGHVISFISSGFLLIIATGLLVFNFFNFHTKAKCFAGDVGSVGIAFILIFSIGLLIVKTANFTYILLLLVYGLDSVSTIFFRLIRKENIFEAHRSHFYQYLANERKIPHLYISTAYAIIQLLINIILFVILPVPAQLPVFLIVVFLFILVRFFIEGKDRLLKYTPQNTP